MAHKYQNLPTKNMRTIYLASFVVISCSSCTATAFVAKPSFFAHKIYRVETKVRSTSVNHGLAQVKSTIENNEIFDTQHPYGPIGRRKWLRGMILTPVLKSNVHMPMYLHPQSLWQREQYPNYQYVIQQ